MWTRNDRMVLNAMLDKRALKKMW